jgi:leader peptidase (prepilin peptidase)/N-methyltransferase
MTALAVFVALFGLTIGSFLNVVIYRLPRGRSLGSPGSACPACGAPIRWSDNVPVAGWLWLRGRCRDCHAPISVRYPIVEFVTMTAFVACYWRFGPEPLLVPRLLLAASLIALFAIDLDLQLLPNAITLPGIVVGLLFSLWLPPGIRDAVLGVLLGGGVLWAIGSFWTWLRGMEAMGGGDVKMLAMVGAFLGWKLVIVTFVISSIVGGLFAAALLVTRKTELTAKLPFGTFLAIGAFIASLWGDPLLDWYLSLYL